MWLFCKSGFFSAVEHFQNKAMIHVRARFAGDLERLCEIHGITADVQETRDNDYRFRMNFDRDTWARIVSEEALSIDYPNFKNAVHDGTCRDRAYMGCWSAMVHGQNSSLE